jgi:hypothetical protein
MRYTMTVGRHEATARPDLSKPTKPEGSLPLVMIENNGFALLQAEFSALVWEHRARGASIHRVCTELKRYSRTLGFDASLRIRFTMEQGIPAYQGAKVKSTIIMVRLLAL